MFKRFTCILQHDETDCAAACIAMISRYYGLKLPIGKIRDLASTDKIGTNVLGIKEACEGLGYEVKAVRAEPHELSKDLNFPFVAHINRDGLLHFVVVYKLTKTKIVVADPAKGLKKLRLSEFLLEWTGILIFLKPTSTFKKGNEKKGIFERFIFLITPNKSLIIHITIATLLNTFIGLIGSFYFKYLIDDILVNNLKNTLFALTIGLIILKIFGLILSTFRSFIILHLSQKINSELMLKYYNHVINLPLSFFEKRKVGEITSRIGDAGEVIGLMIDIIFSLLIDSLMIISIGTLLFFQNLRMFLCGVAFIPIYFIIAIAFIKPFRSSSRRVMESSSQMESFLYESLNGVATVKALSSEEHASIKYESKYIKVLKESFKRRKLGMLSGFIESTVDILSDNIILLFGSLEVINGNISIGQLLTFNTLFNYFFSPIQNFIDLIPNSQSAYVASDRLGDVLDIDQEDMVKGLKNVSLKGDITFNNLSFRYDNHTDILKELTLRIREGERVAIVGESGSGKTTLIKLLMRYYSPQKGSIKIGNYDLRDINLNTLRERIAFVPQDTFLFSGTLMENLKFGFSEISTDKIVEACRASQITEFIDENPQRYEMLITEGGSNLSGGQKQRISIARAILKSSDILVLDEATSSLDVNLEKKICDAIDEISKDMTVITIAHRLSTIRSADKIIVLSKGEVKEVGLHKELLGIEDGIYRNLWNIQMGE